MGGAGPQSAVEILAAEHSVYTISDVARIAGMEIPYTREVPPGPRTTPILLLRGFLAKEEDYFDLRSSIALGGQEAITFSSPKGPGVLGNVHPLHLHSPGKVESLAAYGVMRHIMESSDHDQFDLAPHSLGGKTASSVAAHKPELVRSVIYIASACLDGHSWRQSLERTGEFSGKDLRSYVAEKYAGRPQKLAIDGISRALSIGWNLPKNIGETRAAATGNIRSDLELIGLVHNIKTAALQFNRDPYSPPSEANDIGHLFNVIHIMDGDHLAPQKHPEKVALGIRGIQKLLFPVIKSKMAA